MGAKVAHVNPPNTVACGVRARERVRQTNTVDAVNNIPVS